MKRLQYCSAFLLTCSANLFCSDIHEYRIEQDSLIFNGNSSQGANFTPPFQEPEDASYLLATSKHQIPEVKLSEAPDWVQLNDIAWETFYDHIRPSSTFEFNGKTIQARPSSQYSDNEYFWDQCLIKAGFARCSPGYQYPWRSGQFLQRPAYGWLYSQGNSVRRT